MAAPTTARSCPFAFHLATRRETFLMRSTEPTEVPPYFWTINAICSRDVGKRQRFYRILRAWGLAKGSRKLKEESGRRGAVGFHFPLLPFPYFPHASKTATAASRPASAAICLAVFPRLSFRFGSAPFCRSSLAVSAWP